MRNKYRHFLFTLTVLTYVCCFSNALAAQQPESAPASQAEIVENVDQREQIGEQASGHDDQNSNQNHSQDGHGHDHDHGDHDHDDHGHHHGPEVVLFGAHIGDTGQFFLKLGNFLIFAGLIFWMLKGILSSAFKARIKEIETKLAQSENDKAEGRVQLRELEAKMAGLEQELSGVMAKAESDAEAEKQRILEAARAEADQILAQVQVEIEHHKRSAETELRELVARLAVEGAEARIQRQVVQGDSATRIMDQAIQQIGGAN